MNEGKDREENEGRNASHDEFLELCALEASGNLSEAEQAKLRHHLAVCLKCRQALRDFETIASEAGAELSSGPGDEFPCDPSDATFSQEEAVATFEKRLAEERNKERDGQMGGLGTSQRVEVQRKNAFLPFDRYDLWLPLVASLLLCGTLGILSYRMGRDRGIDWARAGQGNRPTEAAAKETQGADPRPTAGEVAPRDMILAELRREVTQKSAELTRIKAEQAQNQLQLEASAEDKKELNEEKNQLVAERDRLFREASAEQASLRDAQDRIKTLEGAQREDLMRAANLENQIAKLTSELEARDRLTMDQQDLLAKDKDVRELIGARDLYITEIYDVAHNGDTRKAAGRVFYTKGKSLIFYAYDLKDNPSLNEAATFEAWGQRGPDWHQAQKLGVFYEDNATKKRWVVKSNDKKTLDQIDAVFITAEPSGGSERPTGKPLLFTYLKVPPNHP